jgi:photosystem II stability/assembly factor-like uncharacterized protein
MTKFILTVLFLSLSTDVPFAQWNQLISAPGVYIRDILNFNGELYLSTAGTGVYKSTDDGSSWIQINNGLTSQQAMDIYQVISYNGSLYAATTGGIYKSTDDGNDWVKKSNGITIGPGALYEFTMSVVEYNGMLLTGAYNGIYYSTDGAENWTLTNISGEGIEAKNFTLHNGILFAARESINSPIGYKSFDGGMNWEDLTGLSYFNTITFFSEGNYLWAGIVGGVWLSTDNGITWEDRSNGLNLDPYSSSIIRVNGILLTSLKFGGSGIFSSTDDGLNWENISDGLPFLNSIEKLISFNGEVLAATSNGLWQRDLTEIPVELTSFSAFVKGSDVQLNWTTATETNNKGFEIQRSVRKDSFRRNQSEGLPLEKSGWEKIGFAAGYGTTSEPRIYSFTDNNLRNGTYSYRLKQIDFDGLSKYSNTVDVTVNSPVQYSLNQNYPNPFNPSTEISFSLKTDAKVTINIYDILGQKVSSLINNKMNAGEHSIRYDASDMPAGIYIYNLEVNGTDGSSFTAVRKMIFLK